MSTYRMKSILAEYGDPVRIAKHKEDYPHLYVTKEPSEKTKRYFEGLSKPKQIKYSKEVALEKIVERSVEYDADFNLKVNDKYRDLLMLYIFGDKEFEQTELTDNKPSLIKGIMIKGSVGTGKSLLLYGVSGASRFSPNPVKGRFVTENTVVNTDYKELNQFRKPFDLIVDDLGTNLKDREIAIMKQLMEDRYMLFKQKGVKTHLTMNLSITGEFKSIESIYGERLMDRCIEMFNIITITGKSLRK